MTSREPRHAIRLSLKARVGIRSNDNFERKTLDLLYRSALLSYEMLVIRRIAISEISDL